MLILTSPAKTQNFDTNWSLDIKPTRPEFEKEADSLAAQLQGKKISELEKLMHISEKLAQENFKKFQNWNNNKEIEKPALLAYQGDIYRQFKAVEYSKKEQEYAQRSLRILTGLYGVLEGYSLIQPYRLEMKTKLKVGKTKDLYEFWGTKITDHLNTAIDKDLHKLVLNLASEEYAKVVQLDDIKASVVTVNFEQTKNGKQKNYGILSKFARGVMIDWCVKNQVETPEEVKKFDKNGYTLEASDENELLFVSSADAALHSNYSPR